MLSKTELWPVKDRLKDADRHLAYVKGSIRYIKSVEDKQIVNDLVGAIEAQRKAIEQMLEVLDIVARHDFCSQRLQEVQAPDSRMDRRELRRRLVLGDFPDPAQNVIAVPTEEKLAPRKQSAA
jgi:hypothetical protein